MVAPLYNNNFWTLGVGSKQAAAGCVFTHFAFDLGKKKEQ